MEEFAKSGRFAEQEALCRGKAFFGAAFDHVAGESPGSSGETQNGDCGADFADDAANGFREKGGFDFGVEEPQLVYIAFGANGLGEIGAGISEFEFEAHGFGGDENVRENDDGVDTEEVKGLKRDLDG